MTTIDEYLAFVDQLNDHMDCGCYDTHKTLAAEVRRLMQCCAIAGQDHAAYIFETQEKLNAARAEAERLKDALDTINNYDGWHLCDASQKSLIDALEQR